MRCRLVMGPHHDPMWTPRQPPTLVERDPQRPGRNAHALLWWSCSGTLAAMGRTAILHMMIEPELKARLTEAADEDKRSIASLARLLIEDGLNRRDTR